MAIKKGAFDLYVQERQLPHKADDKLVRESHFFDDVDIGDKSSNKTVHKRFTNDVIHDDYLVNNISESVDNPHENNGSQTVHKRFTKDKGGDDSLLVNVSDSEVNLHQNNGSQTVHKRFTNDERGDDSLLVNVSDSEVNLHQNNGSQTVHKRFTNDLSVSGEIDFSLLIGNQRKLILSLYKCIQLNDGLTTRALTLDDISIMASINKKSLKNTLFRLTNAGFISRSEQKVGRGGWVKYKMHSELMNELSVSMV